MEVIDMKRFVYSHRVKMSNERMIDCQQLKEFIMNNLCIDISLIDTYLLWESISESWSAGWLDIETHPEGETREEFLTREMNKRGYFKEGYNYETVTYISDT